MNGYASNNYASVSIPCYPQDAAQAREREVVAAAASLANAISTAEEFVGRLIGRLDPIVRCEPARGCEKEAACPSIYSTQLASALDSQRDRLATLNNRLSSVLDRLEI